MFKVRARNDLIVSVTTVFSVKLLRLVGNVNLVKLTGVIGKCNFSKKGDNYDYINRFL